MAENILRVLNKIQLLTFKEMSLFALKIVGKVGKKQSSFVLQQVVGRNTTEFEKVEIYVNCNSIFEILLSVFLVI